MRMSWNIPALAFCLALAGCASPDPVPYSGLASTDYMRPSGPDGDRRIPYIYETAVDWRFYRNVILEPVSLYDGLDSQFGDLSQAERISLADYMYRRFGDELSRHFRLTNQPGPNTLRIKLTLTGASTTTPVLGPLSRFDIAGGLYNGVQSFRGGEGTMTGSVIYAAEIYDAADLRLLKAFIAKQYPNSFNIGATFGSIDAAETGIDKGAEALVEQLR
ncbi:MULTISPECIES: DUF3313 domain-containing protein [unclassified Azospirillum]|uniref:DUF3313 domain-containing protein n=1 Tax=unclassified Azospirillum TaxID=2630922 RepID=UPI000B6315C5|nr:MULTISPECIES: DUF3313 domain-containing protein [unclassified Azospirillum]SNS90857.1 Protein of unknown function [Azospirillum sp. RU38E]SNT07929.1 Protein of unknown function [Azospirillum sp. RU37A]